jgi:hypothetical protein
MIWAIDYLDEAGVHRRRVFKCVVTWKLMAALADKMAERGCQISRIELVRFSTHAKEA